jgi:hypothetical protein
MKHHIFRQRQICLLWQFCYLFSIVDNNMVLRNEVLEEFQCSVCTEYMFPPISECVRGHALCENCAVQLENCPECRALITYTKNSALEELHGKLDFPCKYFRDGCTFYGKTSRLKLHELDCNYNKQKKNVKCSRRKTPPFFSAVFFFATFILFELYLVFNKEKNGDVDEEIIQLD